MMHLKRALTRPIDAVRRLRAVLPECAAILGLLVAIWVSTVIILLRERAHELEAARGTTIALSEAFAETTARIVSEVDQTLLSARSSYEQLGTEFDIQRWAHNQIRSDQLRVQVALMDKDGWVIRSTLARSNQGRINIADRPHFKYQLDPSRDELYISDPVIGRGSKEQTIQFSRKVVDQNGNFNGVLVLSLGCTQLSQFYDTAGTDEGTVTVANSRGVTIAGDLGSVGKRMAVPPGVDVLQEDNLAAASVATSWDTSKGGLVVYQNLKRYPLTVMITRSPRQIYGRYQVTLRHFLVAGSLASVIVTLLGAFWISQRRRAADSSRALTVTLSSMTQGIAMIDFRGKLSVFNEQALNLLRLPKQGTPNGKAEQAIERLVAAGSPILPGAADEQNEHTNRILESITDDGQVIEVRTTPLPDGGKVHTLTDITEQHRAQSRIRYLAHHDVLTGLPNRVLLAQMISAALNDAAEARRQLVVMFMDLDGFKGVNDTLGHLIGDRLLRHVADMIQNCIGPKDFVARLGGDEFTIVRPDVEDTAGALQLATSLIERISEPIMLEGRELRITASVGVAMYPDHGTAYPDLFKHADIALYQAKNEGRATYRVFEAGMDEKLRLRMRLEEDLRSALDNNELAVYFQPQFETNALRIVGFEALARWHHPRQGTISPADFITLAEECGLINRLGAFVLEQACREAVLWPSACYVAVNVSSIQLLDAGFVDLVRDVLMRTGLPARRLELEITESVMMDHSGHAMAALTSLREIGVRLALDDFGTGFSSLSNLLRFRFEKVKIHTSFVQGQLRDPKARAIVGAILVMSQHMGLAVTAEGVETEAQLMMLRGQKCPLIQGFLCGMPVPAGATRELLLENQGGRRVARHLAGIVAEHEATSATTVEVAVLHGD